MKGGIDPDKSLIDLCMTILLRVLKEDQAAQKCKVSAHIILVAIKGVSRIIERISSRNEFVNENDLEMLLTQAWDVKHNLNQLTSLFHLNLTHTYGPAKNL